MIHESPQVQAIFPGNDKCLIQHLPAHHLGPGGSDLKGKLSILVYATAIPLSFVERWLAFGLYVVVAVMWLIPDRRIEKVLNR